MVGNKSVQHREVPGYTHGPDEVNSLCQRTRE